MNLTEKFLEKINKLTPTIPIKHKRTYNKPLVEKYTTCKCDNCLNDFQKTKKSLAQHTKKQIKHLFCGRKCFNDFIKRKHVLVNCSYCKTNYEIEIGRYNNSIKANLKNFFCNRECHANFFSKKVKFNCFNCNKSFEKKLSEVKENNFCSKQCWYKHNKASRSKLELYLEEKVKNYFPYLPYVCCDRTICRNLELDFYFPDLKLAIEINGIFHYEPIFGQDQLNRAQHNDKGKNYLCKQQGIKLLTLKSIENFTQPGIKQRDWKIFKNMIISELPYCETEADFF